MRSYLMTILFFIIGLVLFISAIYYGNIIKLNGEEEDCYDRFGNKIKGLECTVEGNFDSRTSSQIMFGVLGGSLLILLTFLGWMADNQLNMVNRHGYL